MPDTKPHPLLGKNLLVVTAHPDDESYVLAGTLAANARAGGRTALVCATCGEKGVAHLQRPMSARSLARRRKRELKAACAKLGVHHLSICMVPDGQVERHAKAFTRAVLQTCERFTPAVVVSFGPCGITGHMDHVAAGRVARGVARQLHVPFAAAVLSPKLQRDAKRFLASRRHAPHYHATTVFVSPNLTIRVNARTKQRALRCHRTQMDGGRVFTGFPKYVVQGLLHREYFRIWKKP